MNRILIIEDESLIRYSLTAALNDKDTEVIAMPDGKSGLKALGDWRFDFCFLDINLPDANGLELLSMIRELAPKTKVVMMTGSVVDQNAMEKIRQQAFLFLSKPFDLFRVKRVLEGIGPAEENRFQQFESLEARVAAERRKHRREAAKFKEVSYVTLAPDRGPDEHRAEVLDISDAGTRIRTGYNLEPGSLLQFKNSVKEASGVVRWSSVDKQTSRCLAGVQFIEKAG
jgi:DNA-binding response OmpR family regulator